MLKILKRVRIFKRLREYKAEIDRLRDVVITRGKQMVELKVELMSAVTDNIKSIENFQKLSDRRDEFLKRLRSKIPEGIASTSFDNYKYWLGEPFVVEKYESYKKPTEKEVYIDNISAIKGMDKVLDKLEENKDELEKGKDDEKKGS